MKEVFSPTDIQQFFIDRAHLNLPGHRHLARALSHKVRELLPQRTNISPFHGKLGYQPPSPEMSPYTRHQESDDKKLIDNHK